MSAIYSLDVACLIFDLCCAFTSISAIEAYANHPSQVRDSLRTHIRTSTVGPRLGIRLAPHHRPLQVESHRAWAKGPNVLKATNGICDSAAPPPAWM